MPPPRPQVTVQGIDPPVNPAAAVALSYQPKAFTATHNTQNVQNNFLNRKPLSCTVRTPDTDDEGFPRSIGMTYFKIDHPYSGLRSHEIQSSFRSPCLASIPVLHSTESRYIATLMVGSSWSKANSPSAQTYKESVSCHSLPKSG